MATKTDTDLLAWVLFKSEAALSSGSSRVQAVAASDTTTISVVKMFGETVVRIDDPSLPGPGLVPWPNVAAFGPLAK